MTDRCPLCMSAAIRLLASIAGKAYFECDGCALAFIHRDGLPLRDEERRIYALHRNEPSDPRYRAFLERLAAPLCARLTPGMSGLDYGAGPGPTLATMLDERGFTTVSWDPLFEPRHELLDRRYDFVTCTEVVEHFHQPRVDFDRLVSLVRPGGWLAIMTQWQPPGVPFERWHYVRDPTHVSFYAERTFDWIAEKYGFQLEKPANDVALMRSPG